MGCGASASLSQWNNRTKECGWGELPYVKQNLEKQMAYEKSRSLNENGGKYKEPEEHESVEDRNATLDRAAEKVRTYGQDHLTIQPSYEKLAQAILKMKTVTIDGGEK